MTDKTIQLTINGGEPINTTISDAFQKLVHVIDSFANENNEQAAELKELREFVGAMSPGSEICFKGVVFHLCLDGKWRSDLSRSGTSGNMRYVHPGYDTALDAWQKMKGESK